MGRDDFVELLTAEGIGIDDLAALDRATPDAGLHDPNERDRLWRVVQAAAREAPLRYADARWIERVTDWPNSPIARAVQERARQRDDATRDLEWQTRADALPDHLARPRR